MQVLKRFLWILRTFFAVVWRLDYHGSLWTVRRAWRIAKLEVDSRFGNEVDDGE